MRWLALILVACLVVGCATNKGAKKDAEQFEEPKEPKDDDEIPPWAKFPEDDKDEEDE